MSTLTAIQLPALAEPGGLVLAPLPYEPIRVLCVDDNRDAARSLGSLLRMVGFVAEVCHDGTAALRLAERLRPDACVLDLSMPGMDGDVLARALCAGVKCAPYLIAVTAHGDAAARRRTLAAGFDLHLLKPAEPQELLDALFAVERRVRAGG